MKTNYWLTLLAGFLGCCGLAHAVTNPPPPLPGTFGPYTVLRTLPNPPGYIGDLEVVGGNLFSVESYNGNIHQLHPVTGQVLANWSVPGAALHDDSPFDMPTGLAWTGSGFWMVTRGNASSQFLRHLTLPGGPDAVVTTTFPYQNTGFSPQDLAYVNGLLYAPEYLGPIRIINPLNNTIVGSIPSPSSTVYALTYDGQNLLASGIGGAIWQLNPQTGALLNTWQTGVNQVNGLAYDVASQTLYIGTAQSGIIIAQVPEPSCVTLFALGGFALLRQRDRTKGPKARPRHL